MLVMAVFSHTSMASGSLTMGYHDLSNNLEILYNHSDEYKMNADARMVVVALDIYGDIGESDWVYILSGKSSVSADGIDSDFDEADWYSAGAGFGYKVGRETTIIAQALIEKSEFTGVNNRYEEDVQSIQVMFWRELYSARGWGAKVGVGGHISLSDSHSDFDGDRFDIETKTSGAIFEAAATYQADIFKFEMGYRFRNYAAIGSDEVSSPNLTADIRTDDFTGYDHGLYAGAVVNF
tara:strand:- start:1043 stop:1753 length:711 start_codon:yes stop_codon:yes gene_type:complete